MIIDLLISETKIHLETIGYEDSNIDYSINQFQILYKLNF